MIQIKGIRKQKTKITANLQLVVVSLSSFSCLGCNTLHGLGNLLSGRLDRLSGSSSLLSHRLNNWLSFCCGLILGLLIVADLDSILALLLDELDKILNATVSVVSNWVLLVAGLEEFDGWESFNLIWNIVESSINLGYGDLVGETSIDVKLTEDIVLRTESLAVTTPWCIKFNQDILIIIQDDIIVVLGHDDLDWTFLSLWDRLRLDAWLNLSSNEIRDEL